jgi:Domain of unknown function (DUF4260)
MTVKRLLQLEGLGVMLGGIVLYAMSGGSLLMFILAGFAPDLVMLTYFINVRVGAAAYNIVHTYVMPALLLVLGYLLNAPVVMQIALVWFAHIGWDRLIGAGLKYPTKFSDTHLQHV